MTFFKDCAIGLRQDPASEAGKKRPPNQTGGWDGGARPFWQYRQRVRRNHREAISVLKKHTLCQIVNCAIYQ
jgi:hypothetical protein